MDPDRNLLSFHPGPVPMREEMKNRARRPPGLVVVESVLGESAGVDDSVLRTDIGPTIRRWFATIVESGPHKSAGEPISRIAEAPPAFGRSAAGVGVGIVGTDVAFGGIGDIDAARADRAHSFRAHDGLVGMRLVESLGLRVHVVVTSHIANHQPT